jgi:glycosyltransferase involved in cell wall biosynthesis
VGGVSSQSQLYCQHLKQYFKVYQINTHCSPAGKAMWFKSIKFVNAIFSSITILLKLLQLKSKIDFVHIMSLSYTNYFLFTFPPAILARLLSKKVIIHYHGGSANDFFAKYGLLAKIPLKLSSKIVVPSIFLARTFVSLKFSPMIVPNSVDRNLFKFRERKTFKPVFIIARHLESGYNVECAIKAFAEVISKFPEAQFNIAGDGSQREELVKLAAHLGCQKAITFHGNLKGKEMAELYENSDIFLNSSNIDNAPVSILEAFSAGLPVVSTKAGGIPFMVQDSVNGLLVDCDDHAGMAEKILWLLNNQSETSRIVRHALKEIESLSYDAHLEAILSLYAR